MSLGARVEALASPNLSKLATQKTSRQCKYIRCTLDNERRIIQSELGLYTIHLMRHSALLSL